MSVIVQPLQLRMYGRVFVKCVYLGMKYFFCWNGRKSIFGVVIELNDYPILLIFEISPLCSQRGVFLYICISRDLHGRPL